MWPPILSLLAAASFVAPPRLGGGTRAVRACDFRPESSPATARAALDASAHGDATGAARAATGNVLLVDHLNINHERGRHDLLAAFYFDVLGCAADPRKSDNLASGRKTLWANAGISQFHLPEADAAQVFDGVITLAYAELSAVRSRLAAPPDRRTSGATPFPCHL